MALVTHGTFKLLTAPAARFIYFRKRRSGKTLLRVSLLGNNDITQPAGPSFCLRIRDFSIPKTFSKCPHHHHRRHEENTVHDHDLGKDTGTDMTGVTEEIEAGEVNADAAEMMGREGSGDEMEIASGGEKGMKKGVEALGGEVG